MGWSEDGEHILWVEMIRTSTEWGIVTWDLVPLTPNEHIHVPWDTSEDIFCCSCKYKNLYRKAKSCKLCSHCTITYVETHKKFYGFELFIWVSTMYEKLRGDTFILIFTNAILQPHKAMKNIHLLVQFWSNFLLSKITSPTKGSKASHQINCFQFLRKAFPQYITFSSTRTWMSIDN